FREDSSNQDLAFTRNRVRHELMPYLAQHFNPQVVQALCRLGSLAAETRRVIARPVRLLMQRAIVEQDENRVVLDIRVLHDAPGFLVCELLRRVWADRSWPLQELGLEALERVA